MNLNFGEWIENNLSVSLANIGNSVKVNYVKGNYVQVINSVIAVSFVICLILQ